MSKLEYDPGKAIGKGLLDMDRNPKASLEEIRRINLSR